MKRHSIIVRLDRDDCNRIAVIEKASHITELCFIEGDCRIRHGIGQMLGQLATRGMYPSENAIDLALLAATVTAADTRIPRIPNAQDSWTREIDLYVPVAEPTRWSENGNLIKRTLQFLTGDLWRVIFRPRQQGMDELIDRPSGSPSAEFDSACLFSGGLDSFVGAIDLLEARSTPLFVSHYRDASTASQMTCANRLGHVYGDLEPRYVRANVSFDKYDMPNLGSETTTRGRSFIFFALATMAASALDGNTPLFVPENGFISLNVPLDTLRLGAWSTRTTHPFYMARWQELLNNLGLSALIINPYRFSTKGEMLSGCQNIRFLRETLEITTSCSSLTKGRYKKLSPGHCGYCAPCLIRRAAIHTAFNEDPTSYSIPQLDTHRFDPRSAEATDIRAFQMMNRRIGNNPRLADILVHKPGPLGEFPIPDLADYSDVFRRGHYEVGSIVDNVIIGSV